ncbi:MAG: hypothetical protein DRO95_06075, partial [Candidatus Altiarchaeales archaeon]
VEKFFARLGKDRLEDEVDHPLVRFKLNTSEPLYRITAFYTRYVDEAEWRFEELGITDGAGEGSALKITGPDFVDIVMMYSGDSTATVENEFGTDGSVAFIRNKGGLDYLFCRECSLFKYGNVEVLNFSEKVDLALVDLNGSGYSMKIDNDDNVYLTLKVTPGLSYTVLRNGQVYGNWNWTDSEHIRIYMTFGSLTEYEVIASGVDNEPPGCVSDLHEIETGETWILWGWTNPSDLDYHHAEVYLDGNFYGNVTAPENEINVTGLLENECYRIGIKTVDSSGNVNDTLVVDDACTVYTASTSTTTTIYVGGGGGAGGGHGSGAGVISTQPSCFDGIQNQGEEGIDCGGPCLPCPSCFDGIQNQGEEGVDCGGPCEPCGVETTIAGEVVVEEKVEIIRMEEKFDVDLEAPDFVLVGERYGVNVSIENTGDFPLRDLVVVVENRSRRINLDLGEKVMLKFNLIAPEREGRYEIEVRVYHGDRVESKKRSVWIKYSPLILRWNTTEEGVRVIMDSDVVGGVIELEVYKKDKLVYGDIIEVTGERKVVDLKPGRYRVRARLRKDDTILEENEIMTEVEEEFKPTNLDPFVFTPLGLIDVYLLMSVINALRRGNDEVRMIIRNREMDEIKKRINLKKENQ